MKRSTKVAFLVAAAVVLIGITGCCYRAMAVRALKEEIANTPRNTETQVITGTEAIGLGGPSDRACLLIHGWMGSRIDFNDLGTRLAEQGFYVRMMRLPGHGTSPIDLERMTAENLLDGVRTEFKSLRATHKEIVVIGFSMGGALAVLLASQEPVDRLILAAPFFHVTYRLRYVLSPELWNRLLSPFFPYTIKGKAFVKVNREEAKSRLFSYGLVPTKAVTVLCEIGRQASDPDVLNQIECPVLLLHSEGDEAACPDAARQALAQIAGPKKRLVLFEDSNHHLFWDYDAETVMAEILLETKTDR